MARVWGCCGSASALPGWPGPRPWTEPLSSSCGEEGAQVEAGVRSTGTPHAEKPVLQVGTRVQGLWSCSLVFTAAATKYGAQWRAPSTGPWGRDTRGGGQRPARPQGQEWAPWREKGRNHSEERCWGWGEQEAAPCDDLGGAELWRPQGSVCSCGRGCACRALGRRTHQARAAARPCSQSPGRGSRPCESPTGRSRVEAASRALVLGQRTHARPYPVPGRQPTGGPRGAVRAGSCSTWSSRMWAGAPYLGSRLLSPCWAV